MLCQKENEWLSTNLSFATSHESQQKLRFTILKKEAKLLGLPSHLFSLEERICTLENRLPYSVKPEKQPTMSPGRSQSTDVRVTWQEQHVQ